MKKQTLTIATLLAAMATAATTGCTVNQPPAEARLAARAASQEAGKAHCVRDTGSRIKPKEGECRGPGRSYTRDELERTGEGTTAEALRRLDPSLTP